MPRPPFDKELPLKRGILDRLLGREPSVNARIALKNKLSEVTLYSEITSDFFTALQSKYKFDVRLRYAADFEDWYRTAAHYYLGKSPVAKQEWNALTSLAAVLNVPEQVKKQAHLAEAEPMFAALVKIAAIGGRQSTDVVGLFHTLPKEFGISEEEANALFDKFARHRLDSMDKALADKTILSPEDEKRVIEVASKLGLQRDIDAPWMPSIARARRNWQLIFGNLAAVPTSLTLPKGEVPVWSFSASRYEFRTERQSTAYSGMTGRVKIMRGVYYRIGNISSSPITREVLQEVDKGELVLTTRRLIFAGARGTTSAKWENILEFTPHSDGVEVRRSSGKNPIFTHTGNSLDCSALMYRMLNPQSTM